MFAWMIRRLLRPFGGSGAAPTPTQTGQAVWGSPQTTVLWGMPMATAPWGTIQTVVLFNAET